MFYVYIHKRLSSGMPFYVGKGHGNRAFTHNSRNQHWKNIVQKDGGLDVEIIANNMDERSAFRVEMETIAAYRLVDINLVNRTDGGDGPTGYRNPNGAHNKGKPCTEEMKARISATNKAKGLLPPCGWNRGKKTPPEVIEKRRPAMLAAWAKAKAAGERKTSIETRAKQSAAKLGIKLSDDHRMNMSLAMKANKYVRVHPDMTGFVHSAETRAKMSDGAKRRCAAPEERARLSAIMKERWRKQKARRSLSG